MRQPTFVAAPLMTLVLLASGQTYDSSFPPGQRFVLAPAEAAPLLRQCSRPSPEGATGYWEPSDAEIRQLELRLVGYLGNLTGSEAPPTGIGYHRQYVGFFRDGTRLIAGIGTDERGGHLRWRTSVLGHRLRSRRWSFQRLAFQRCHVIARVGARMLFPPLYNKTLP
jgi:hypothetical protein